MVDWTQKPRKRTKSDFYCVKLFYIEANMIDLILDAIKNAIFLIQHDPSSYLIPSTTINSLEQQNCALDKIQENLNKRKFVYE